MPTTIEQFLQMNPDYQRLALTKIFDLIHKLHHELSAIKSYTADIKYGFLGIDENTHAAKQKALEWDEAEELNRENINDIKDANKKRLPYIHRAFDFIESLLKICADPKKYAVLARQAELNG